MWAEASCDGRVFSHVRSRTRYAPVREESLQVGSIRSFFSHAGGGMERPEEAGGAPPLRPGGQRPTLPPAISGICVSREIVRPGPKKLLPPLPRCMETPHLSFLKASLFSFSVPSDIHCEPIPDPANLLVCPWAGGNLLPLAGEAAVCRAGGCEFPEASRRGEAVQEAISQVSADFK